MSVLTNPKAMTPSCCQIPSYQTKSSVYPEGTQYMKQSMSTTNNNVRNPLYYYPPEPRETFRLHPLVLKTFKTLDVDDLQDCFGRSLQQRRNQEVSKQTEINKIFDEDLELQSIKANIEQAKLNRDRAHQIHEFQARRMQNLVKDAELDEKVLENLDQEQLMEQEKERQRKENMITCLTQRKLQRDKNV